MTFCSMLCRSVYLIESPWLFSLGACVTPLPSCQRRTARPGALAKPPSQKEFVGYGQRSVFGLWHGSPPLKGRSRSPPSSSPSYSALSTCTFPRIDSFLVHILPSLYRVDFRFSPISA